MTHLESFLNKSGCQLDQHLEDILSQKYIALQQQSSAKGEVAWLLVELYETTQ
jgi:hypothetical protein